MEGPVIFSRHSGPNSASKISNTFFAIREVNAVLEKYYCSEFTLPMHHLIASNFPSGDAKTTPAPLNFRNKMQEFPSQQISFAN